VLPEVLGLRFGSPLAWVKSRRNPVLRITPVSPGVTAADTASPLL
jgi:hypothetical protein